MFHILTFPKLSNLLRRAQNSNLSTYAFRVHANHSSRFVKGDPTSPKWAIMGRDKNSINWEGGIPKRMWL